LRKPVYMPSDLRKDEHQYKHLSNTPQYLQASASQAPYPHWQVLLFILQAGCMDLCIHWVVHNTHPFLNLSRPISGSDKSCDKQLVTWRLRVSIYLFNKLVVPVFLIIFLNLLDLIILAEGVNGGNAWKCAFLHEARQPLTATSSDRHNFST